MGQCEDYLKQQHDHNITHACEKYPIINKNSLNKHEKDLYDELYLPRYLLYELDALAYYETLRANDLFDEYKKQFFKHPHNIRMDMEAKEFYEWVQKHKKYNDLLHKDNYKKLTTTLDMLNQLQQDIINDFTDKGYLKKDKNPKKE